MDLSLTDSQHMLQDAARRFVASNFPTEVKVDLRKAGVSCPPELWQNLADVGWLGLVIPEEYGGAGATIMDAVVLLEEFGGGPACSTLLTSNIVTAAVIAEAGTPEQRRQLLPGMVAGKRVATLAVTEADGGWAPESILCTASRVEGGFRIDGVKLFVMYGGMETDYVVAARRHEDPDVVTLFVVDATTPGVRVRMLPGFLGLQAEVTFDGVTVGEDCVLGGVDRDGWAALESAVERVLPVVCSYQIGSCRTLFEMSVDYSKTRKQFGVPIGKFQRVQDHIIRAVNALDAARWTTYEAAWRVDTGRPASANVHMAAAVTAEGHVEAANAAHEVFAGIGTDPYFGVTLHTELSRMMFDYLGSPKVHKRAMADSLAW